MYHLNHYHLISDSQCGHGRCFECMFRYTECPICFNGETNGYEESSINGSSSRTCLDSSIKQNYEHNEHGDKYGQGYSNFASIYSRGCPRSRTSDAAPRISAFSKESGFQSSYSSTSSVCSGSRISKSGESSSVSLGIIILGF